jgi:hypothetical protein
MMGTVSNGKQYLERQALKNISQISSQKLLHCCSYMRLINKEKTCVTRLLAS